MKRIIVVLIAMALCLSVTACGKSEMAKAVDGQIHAIGEVTLKSNDVITAAESAVKALSPEDHEQLENLEVLAQARETYEQLVSDAAVAEVEEAIGKIGNVTLESNEVVSAAEDLYNDLTSDERAKVGNASTLTVAVAELKELKKGVAEQLLGGMRKEEDRIENLSFYYPKAWRFYANGNWAADIRCFILPYLGRSGDETWLRLVYNYTDDDWVFYKKVIVVADGERFVQSFKYFDIVHDNEAGDVWEYIDTEVGAYEEEMLWAIANSEETLVRFEGDDYYHDFTVNSTDKQAIKDIMNAYDALK